MTFSSNKHFRAADVKASPIERKPMVELECLLDATAWAGAAAFQTALPDSVAALRGQLCSGFSALWQPVCAEVCWEALEESSFLLSFVILTLDRHGIFSPPHWKADKTLTL